MGGSNPTPPQSHLWHCGRPAGAGHGVWPGHA
nr:MAG TPA: hypothetical protein [Caudoviricetes sp.]